MRGRKECFRQRLKGMDTKRFVKNIKDRVFTPIRLVMLSFFVIIAVGTVLLLMPFATKQQGSLSFIDALFTATSATCVTGLSVESLHDEFTVFGQIVVLLLVQLGGLGFMTLTSTVYILIRHKISLRKRLSMREDLSQPGMADLKKLTLDVIKLTATAELTGAVLLAIGFSRYYDFGTSVWYGIFHSVTAFCNAGFDIVSGSTSLQKFYSDPYILIVLALLIIIGGIGFVVVSDVFRVRSWRKFKQHTKIVLPMTLALILVGTFSFLVAEYSNPATLGKMSLGDKFVNAFFQSVTARTAGFASIDQGAMTDFSKSMTIVLMFVGACPGGTGGGIKTTTLFVLLVTVYATIRQKREIIIDMRSVGRETLAKAATILTLALSVAVLSLMGLEICMQGSVPWSELMFEQVSAYATVGLSEGITPSLNTGAKLILTLNMYIGRIGSFGFFMAFSSTAKAQAHVKYPEAGIIL